MKKNLGGVLQYDQASIEPKWQKVWEEKKTFQVDIENAQKPFYNLAMFPYPSAEGLHVGHIIPYSGVDTYGRLMRMKGFQVFEPMGFDAFGIHSENFAIKKGIHPATLTAQTTKYFKDEQMKKLGTMFDWDRMVDTSNPNYYRWTQWLFVQMFKAGLAIRKKALVNWCPSCKTVLSDEQVIKQTNVTNLTNSADVCERCKTQVERKEMEQWFFKITKYAERLLAGTEKINWSQKTLTAQRNWIGKSIGINITYEIDGLKDTVMVFTTAPVNFGMTFLVLAPEHEIINKIISGKLDVSEENRISVMEYVENAKKKTEIERISEGKEKTGAFTGLYAINRINNKKVPVYVTDFVLGHVGTGAVQGCPGHDKKDFQFAKKFGLPIIRVLVGKDGYDGPIETEEQVVEHGMEGTFVNSEFLNGLGFEEGLQKTMDYFEEKGWGKRQINYKLRDWCISRQRYWGPPIPMIHCQKCEWQPVPEKNLPVLLPETNDYLPDGSGKSPLAKISSFVKTKCPNCGGKAERETDVSDTFLDSAWYFLRYPSVGLDKSSQNEGIASPVSERVRNDNNLLPWDPSITKKWLPVDMYIGGNEHAVLHLMYSRFVTMVLHDMGYLTFEEPFTRFFAHGLMIKDGAKMSKSRGNVVNPDLYLKKYGADALRMYVLFLGPYDAGGDFRDSGIEGMTRFLGRIYRYVMAEITKSKSIKSDQLDKFDPSFVETSQLYKKMQKLIKAVGEDLENLKFNTAIAKMMEYLNKITNYQLPITNQFKNQNFQNKNVSLRGVSKANDEAIYSKILENYILLLAPLAPHLAEELYQELRKINKETNFVSVHDQPWPTYDPQALNDEEITIVIQINGKVREKLIVNSIRQAQDKSEEFKDKEKIVELAKKAEKIEKYLEGKKIVKTIYVPLKLVNFVVQ